MGHVPVKGFGIGPATEPVFVGQLFVDAQVVGQFVKFYMAVLKGQDVHHAPQNR